MDFQVVLNTFASDVFRNQADYDYISARANYRMRLRQQFLWSAHQAVEKYLKAILLFNGLSARYYKPVGANNEREFGHDLNALVAQVKDIEVIGFEIDQEDEKFLSFLSQLGGANRYLTKSAYNTSDAIHRLDRLVWHIRRYCQYFVDRSSGCQQAVPGMQKKAAQLAIDSSKRRASHSFALIGGELEAVVRRDQKDPARRALVWANLFYGKKKRLNVIYDSFSSSEISPYDRGWLGVDWELLKKYVKP